MVYDDIKFMETEETCVMHINQAFEWVLKDNKLVLKVFSYNKTLRVIELTDEVTQKFIGWLIKNYDWPDEMQTQQIKELIEKERDKMNRLLADLENPSED